MEKYDIEELEISKNKVFFKKDTPPNSTLQIFKIIILEILKKKEKL